MIKRGLTEIFEMLGKYKGTNPYINVLKREVCDFGNLGILNDFAVQYIESNYSKELGLDAICSEINYSKSYFCYLFKAVTGKTYVEYLNEVRISNACRMLSETDMNIGDISFEVGYKTIANFNKYFKIFTGTTPSKYRLQKNKPTRN